MRLPPWARRELLSRATAAADHAAGPDLCGLSPGSARRDHDGVEAYPLDDSCQRVRQGHGGVSVRAQRNAARVGHAVMAVSTAS